MVGFQDQGFQVSLSDWRAVRTSRTDEGVPCDQGWGYVVLNTEAGRSRTRSSWRSVYGTCVSLKNGVWDPDGGAWDRSRLKFINLPVLKPHGNTYAVTACVKNYMGVVTDSLNTNSHSGVLRWSDGRRHGRDRPALTSIFSTAFGPAATPVRVRMSGSSLVTRSDQLVASTDPIAADIWATTNILIPAFLANGYLSTVAQPQRRPRRPQQHVSYLSRPLDGKAA